MTDWTSVSLGNFISLRRGHDLPERDRSPGRIPVVGSGGIVGWHNKSIASGPGVTVGRAANLGVPRFVKDDFWPLNTTLYITDYYGNDVRFAYYLFLILDLSGFNSGSVQPMLNRNYIRDFPVLVPQPHEQRAISAVLGALDDKIAVNERIAGAARELARARFTEAVRFDDYGDSPLATISELISRGVAPRYTSNYSEILVVNQKCIRDGRVRLDAARRTLTDLVPPAKRLRKHDILVNSTGVGTLGRVARWTAEIPCTLDSHVTIVRFDPARVDPVCAGFAMFAAQPEIEVLGEGSTGQTELNRTKLGAVRVVLPSPKVAAELRPLLDSLEDRGDAALAESVALEQLRDVLLPGLMSGEIRVRDAEKVVEEAT